MANYLPVSDQLRKQIKAPTLVLSDTGDYRVGHSRILQLYHGLKDNGVPTKFFAYPSRDIVFDPVRQRDIDRRWMRLPEGVFRRGQAVYL